MRKQLHVKANSVQRIAKLICIVLAMVLIWLTHYYLWNNYLAESKKELKLSAAKATETLDNLIKSLELKPFLSELRQINQTNCLDLLNRINFNTLAISGLAIENDKGLMCSTLSTDYAKPILQNSALSLNGPFLSQDKTPYLILQQKINKESYLIIYILKAVIENKLKPFLNQQNFIGLYNLSTNHYLIKEGQASLVTESISQPSTMNSIESPLKTLTDFKIVIKARLINYYFFYKEIIFILGITLLAIFLYIQFHGLINSYYSLDKDILAALKRKLFIPTYQPIYNAETKSYAGAEVLVRWQVSIDDMIMPDEFIADTEKSGLIIPITLQLMRRVFKETRVFLKKHPDFYLSFNISSRHFNNELFFTRFDELCVLYNINPAQIMLELTERDLLNQEDESLVKKMNHLRQEGFLLAIDDFGTGHASIQYLQHFPFNYIKIDKIFIHAIGTGAITESLNDGIIHMAKKINLNIIAEGVETKEQLDFLTIKGVKLIQGFYLSKALPFTEFINQYEKKINVQ